MIERQRYSLGRVVSILPGDLLVVEVEDRATKEKITFREQIGRTMKVDTIVTFDVKDQYGLVEGIGAIFGKSK